VTRGGLRRIRRAPYAAAAALPSRGRLSLFDDHRLASGQRQAAVKGMVLLTAPIKKKNHLPHTLTTKTKQNIYYRYITVLLYYIII